MNQNKLVGVNILDNSKNSNSDNSKKEYDDFQSKQAQEKLEDSKSDRELKKDTQEFIKMILFMCVGTTLLLIISNALAKFFKDKELYSEWFLSVLIGSQLIILPFSLLFIVAKHLFPNKDK